jgi:hypothetical protein
MLKAHVLLWLALTTSASAGGLANPPKLAYATYLDTGWTANAIAADSAGNAYIGGASACGASVLKLDPSGVTVLWSTCVSADSVVAVTLDSAGSVYALAHTGTASVAGTSTVFKLKAGTGSLVSSMPFTSIAANAFALMPQAISTSLELRTLL